VAAVALSIGCAAHDAASDSQASRGNESGTHADDGETAQLGTREIELTSDTALRIGFGKHSKIRGRLLDVDGKPISGKHVGFALIGRPVDSAITSLDAQTDDDGAFSNTLIAGESDATFRVRISNEAAYDTYVDVAVSNAGFGTLIVTASYGGDRAVEQRSVFAVAGVDCKDAERMAGDPMATFADKEKEARLPALPADTSYAVTVVAEGADGTVVARGCIDGVNIESDVETPIEIALEDQALKPKGEFVLSAEIDATLPASALSTVLRSAEEAAIVGDTPGQPAPPDAEARFLLDSHDAVLRSDDFAADKELLKLADALATARMQDVVEMRPDHALQGELEIASRGPLAAAASIAMLSQADLEHLHIEGSLVLASAIAVHPQRIAAVPARTGAGNVLIDLVTAKTKVTTEARFRGDRDALELTRVRFGAQLGALAAQVVRAVMSTQSPGRGEAVHKLLGCSTLGAWLHAQSYASAAACDDDCLNATCERAAARLQSAAETALLATDEARPWISFSTTFALQDTDGDLIADELDGEAVSGEWEAASDSQSGGDALSGTITAVPQPVVTD
jgi:hypothetical protein